VLLSFLASGSGSIFPYNTISVNQTSGQMCAGSYATFSIQWNEAGMKLEEDVRDDNFCHWVATFPSSSSEVGRLSALPHWPLVASDSLPVVNVLHNEFLSRHIGRSYFNRSTFLLSSVIVKKLCQSLSGDLLL